MRKVLKFSTKSCGPCKALSAALEKNPLDVELVEIDVDTNYEMASKYQIRGVPTLVLLQGESEISRVVGTKPVAELQKWVKQ